MYESIVLYKCSGNVLLDIEDFLMQLIFFLRILLLLPAKLVVTCHKQR